MSETNSLHPLEHTTDETRSILDGQAIAPDVAGHRLFERLGVGGMGEVYRCGDDALGRDLALKVLRSELHGAAAEERFLREARLTGSLQHPGIVPIHQLSRLADGRPCYTMKLVRGRTFADILRDESIGPDRLPRLLAIVEKVCQAVAFAHSKGVIHRDLKPANVMVGEFGEVQVMDWGLAKDLHAGAEANPAARGVMPAADGETGEWVAESTGLSRAGTALGTLAYMPPEQAAGDWAIVDERADVFALGAMLCEILSGKPPYHGANRENLLRRVRRGDMAEALGRLETCGADAALRTLCRECLAAMHVERPRHAGVVAERLASYEAEVRERLRQTELQRVAAEARASAEAERAREAQARAVAERRARRQTLALTAATLVLIAAGVGGWWWQRRQQEQADRAVGNGLAQAELLAEQARADPLQKDKYHQALEAARVAAQLADNASADSRRRAEELIVRLQQEEEAARKDRELLAALLDVRGPREGPKYTGDAKGMMMALAEPTADEQFAAAFRRWGLDVDDTPPSEAAALLKARPAVVGMEVSAALDDWASERRRRGKAKAKWQRLADLAALLDDDPGSKRRELWEIQTRDQLPVKRLRQLAEQTDAATEPILGLLTLARMLFAAGEQARAEQLLRAALVARPQEVVLHHMLGQMLTSQQPPRWRDAIECYAAARVARPDLGVNLATVLLGSGRDGEGLDLLDRLVSETPNNSYLHFQKANALRKKGRLDEAMTEYRKALALDPKYSAAHNDLGVVLHNKGRLDAAMAEYRKALALDPKSAFARNNLGMVLQYKGRLDAAMTEYRKAIAFDPKNAPAHNNLGEALYAKRRLDEAMTEYRKVIALDPKNVKAHNDLGLVLQDKGRLDEALAESQKAIALDPKSAPSHNNLGTLLQDKGRLDAALAEYQKAIALDPKYAPAHNNLGNGLYVKRRLDAALAEYRKAIALDPKFALPHFGLGEVLHEKGCLDAALAEYQKAIALDPKFAHPHYMLGNVLRDKGRLDEAIAKFRLAIRLNPDFAEAHNNLGLVLQGQGRFEEALDHLRRGHELGSKQPGWRYPSAQGVGVAERLLALNKKLPAILTGEAAPANLGEAVTLAHMCQLPYQKKYAASARLYADAFAAEPKLAADLQNQHRYNAVCSAVLAAAGKGEDVHLLPDKVAAMFRRWALKWLRDDLAAYAKLAERDNPQANQAIRQRLLHWQSDADLTAVRDPKALARLAEHERDAWQTLWREVEELAGRLK